jgi:hypothetical protein
VYKRQVREIERYFDRNKLYDDQVGMVAGEALRKVMAGV